MNWCAYFLCAHTSLQNTNYHLPTYHNNSFQIKHYILHSFYWIFFTNSFRNIERRNHGHFWKVLKSLKTLTKSNKTLFFQVLIWAFQPDANSKHGSHRWSKVLSLLLNSWPKPRSKVSSRKWVDSWLSKFESYKNLKFSGHISLVHVALSSKLLPVASSFGKHSTGKVTRIFP